MEKLNIALVHEWITNVAGSERVLLVLKEMFPTADIYTSVYDEDKAAPFKDFNIQTSFLQKIPFLKKKRELLIPFTPFAFEQFDLSKYDLVISSTSMAAKGVITKPDTVHISYCHTPPRYLWEADIDPRAKKGSLHWLRENTVHKMRIWDRLAADRVDYFFANSKYIARRIKKYYGKDSAVVYPLVDLTNFLIASSDDIKDYYLFVSRLIDYKRCDVVVEAFNKLGLPLKVIGSGPEKAKLVKMAKDNIEFLGYLSDDDMKKYYSQAKAFVFAAEEDFGLVPVEAMASGRPVIAYAKGGVTETVVDGVTGIFFQDQTAQSLIEAVNRFNPQGFSSDKIREHAEKFSKDKFKENFMTELNNILTNFKKEEL